MYLPRKSERLALVFLSALGLYLMPTCSHAMLDNIPTQSQVAPAPEVNPYEVQGNVLMARGQFAAALEAYQKVEPRSAAAWNHIGVAYHHLFAFDQATNYYERALAIDPHYAVAYNNMGAAYYGEGRYGDAEHFYRLALKYDRRNATYFRNLGTAYFAGNSYKKGAKAYEQAFKLDPAIFDTDRAGVKESGTPEQRIAFAIYTAEIFAMAGRSADALESLRKAVSYGFNDRHRLLQDKELASLRDLPEFHQLLPEKREK